MARASGQVGRSAREHRPEIVPDFVEAAGLLAARRHPELGGLLLVALIERELFRPGIIDRSAGRLGSRAAALLARGRAGTLAARVARAAGDPSAAAAYLAETGQPSASRQVLAEGRRRTLGASLPPLVRHPNESVPSSPELLPGELRRPVRWLEQHGEAERALRLADALRWHRVAARLARSLSQPARAAEYWALAGAPLESGKAWLEAGRNSKALEQLVLVPLDHPRHRTACVLAARVARRTGALPFELHHLLGPFLRSPPRDDAEVQALVQLASLYADNGMDRSAVELLDAALAVRSERDDLVWQRNALRLRIHDPSVDDQLIAQDASFHGRLLRKLGPAGPTAETSSGALPELPELPELPDLPDLPDLSGVALDALRDRPPTPTLSPPAATWVHAPTMVPESPGDRPSATIVVDDGQPGVGGRAQAKSADTYAGSVWVSNLAESASSEPACVLAGEVFRTGATIGERYRLRGLLGEGAMGTVFRAEDLELGEDIALKVLTVPVRNPKTVARFRQELRLTRHLTHANIVRLYDIGVYQDFRYITMELLQGADLRRCMEEGFNADSGLELVVVAARALQAAHDNNVFHRDVKPENLFVLDSGGLKVMDFGLARTGESHTLDESSMMAGTPAYMAPEQASDFAHAGAAADQYALGIVCYELVTGQPPFRHAEIWELLRMHREQIPDPPSSRRADVPAALDRVILRALEKDPRDRFPSCDALATALELFLG